MIKLPIRQLIELIMRNGDIDSRLASKGRMTEGAVAHRTLQKTYRDLYADYQSEVFLSQPYSLEGIDYQLEGRADGIFSLDGEYTVEEIKTTVLPMDLIDETSHPAHWGQAKCYAYMLARQNCLADVSVQLTYSHLETREIRKFQQAFTSHELDDFVTGLIEKYSAWARFSAEWEKIRECSIKSLPFPYPLYRQGQRELAEQAYRTIVRGQKLFAQAPTGTGKTISVLFPAIKAMGEGKTSKIFYLTAKTITRQAAEEAFANMRQDGLRMKTLNLTAKEKVCCCKKLTCNPDYCQYARGHYDRVNEAILEAIQECDDLSRTVIEQYAQKHQVCPFELALDLSLLVDCIICDYNYVFDPRVYLRRFFADNSGDYVFLIDEAHNLVDRSREMFSAQLGKKAFYLIKKQYKGRNKALDKVLTKINKFLIELRKQCGEEGYRVDAAKPEEFIDLIDNFVAKAELMLKEERELNEDKNFLQLYFDCLGFAAVAEFYDERYVTLAELQGDEVSMKLFCLDPSFLLREVFKRGNSAILFSATLTPLIYFREILGGVVEDQLLSLDSPFDQANLRVMICDRVSTRFHDRELSRSAISNLIGSFVSCQTGNYIIYFPSYRYMQNVFADFTTVFPDIDAVMQQPNLTEDEREDFLSSFGEDPARTYVAFCVLGGIFSEGIDLKGSRLIGAVIVSVGLPQLSKQQDIIRDYFYRQKGMGYEYAYMYPGMNKVLQAAGRVIRSEEDKGAILLVDERYSHRGYLQLYPKHWRSYLKVRTSESLEQNLNSFWSGKSYDGEILRK